MKIGMRKPSLKKRISARTSVKRQVIHRTGAKAMVGQGILKSTHITRCILVQRLIFLS